MTITGDWNFMAARTNRFTEGPALLQVAVIPAARFLIKK